jgi:hypothetical protein
MDLLLWDKRRPREHGPRCVTLWTKEHVGHAFLIFLIFPDTTPQLGMHSPWTGPVMTGSSHCRWIMVDGEEPSGPPPT